MKVPWSVIKNVAGKWISLDDSPSVLDLDSVWDATETELKTVLVRFLRDFKEWTIDKRTIKEFNFDEAIDIINSIYRYSINYLKAELFYTDEELRGLEAKVFQNIDEVIQFLEETNRPRWGIYCTIAKMFLSVCDGHELFNDRIQVVKQKTEKVIENKLKSPLQIEEEREDELLWSVYTHGRNINFIIRKRVKSNESNISKGIRDPNYLTSWYLSDLYGVTFEVENKDDIPYLMEFIAWKVFKKWVYEIKNKGMLSKSDIEEIDNLDPVFKQKLLDNLEIKKKDDSWSDYSDIKLYTPLFKDDSEKNLSLEIKFVVNKNINEKWLQLQSVYGYFKKVSERIRLDGFVKPEYLETVAREFLWNLQGSLDDNLWRNDKDLASYKMELAQELREKWFLLWTIDFRNLDTKSRLDEYLLTWLVSYYKSKLTAINKWKNSNKLYYTKERNMKMSELWVIKDIFEAIS